MSKADLIQNEDFNEYQKDLEARLVAHIRDLHHLLTQPTTTISSENDHLMRLNTKRALIAEMEIILGLPVTYIKKQDVQKAATQKKATQFIDLFRSVFMTENGSTDPSA